jgi:N-acetylmuramoyl-L-alanine amidase
MRGDRSVRFGLVGILLIAGIIALGGLLSSFPVSGLRCPEPAAWVVLDPGHGGEDPGAINDTMALVERELALDIAHRAKAQLEMAGYSVALTREDAATGYLNTPRGTIANLCHALAYVSIHLNSFGEPEPNYVKTFWGIEEKDAAFAATMQNALVNRLQPGTDLGDAGLEQLENGALLTARMPAILVEPVFLSNPDEAARIADPTSSDRLDAIAEAISNGVAAWFWAEGTGPETSSSTALAPVITPQDRLLAPPRGSAARIISSPPAAVAKRPEELAAYVAEVYRLAPLVGLDPAVVVAQSALETGWWQSPAWAGQLNPAGIGVTSEEVVSPTWGNGADAARAQIVHLYLYAAGPIPPDHPLAPYIALDPRYDAALSARRAGIARTIADLAESWAIDPEYAESIARAGTKLYRGR